MTVTDGVWKNKKTVRSFLKTPTEEQHSKNSPERLRVIYFHTLFLTSHDTGVSPVWINSGLLITRAGVSRQ